MIIGYARVSTAATAAQDQNLDLQTDELTRLGCQKIYQEKMSSGKERPQLIKMIENLREGDSVIVWKLDRLARSLKELKNLIEVFRTQK
jgi:DNA invertase Pin-like site-specific DNA recombinase